MGNLSPNLLTILFVILGLVVFSLAIYLGIVLSKLKYQKNTVKKLELDRDIKQQERAVYLKDSILILSRAAVQKQCELSEACIRIKKLLENYPDLEKKVEFLPIQKMYNDLSDFDYLEARSELSSKEKFNQDKKRFKIEDGYRDEMVESLGLLINHFNTIA